MPVALNWSSESITVLGCRIGNDVVPDWDSLLTKFESQLSLWKSRQLSFRGRALIANVLGLSLFWYQATVFDVPKVVIAKINKILFPFVWNKKKEWMARSSVVQPLHDGALRTWVSARISYSLLGSYSFVEHRSVVKFRDLGISVNWKEAWSSLRLWRFVRSVQDTSWLSFHGILPTADRLLLAILTSLGTPGPTPWRYLLTICCPERSCPINRSEMAAQRKIAAHDVQDKRETPEVPQSRVIIIAYISSYYM
ncbi:Hypothetical predicted protein, partial [Paramuricea clavata]